jgi:hypothetical protein
LHNSRGRAQIAPPSTSQTALQPCLRSVIRSFRHKGLRDLFLTGRSSGVRLDLRKRCLARLDALDAATELSRSTFPAAACIR